MKTAIVSSKELGTNCWSPKRFCGGRCNRVLACKYPEKETCKAVASEVEFITERKTVRIEQIEQVAKRSLEQLNKQSSRKLRILNG